MLNFEQIIRLKQYAEQTLSIIHLGQHRDNNK